jgi:hypothetical protein
MLACLGTHTSPSLFPSLMMSEVNHDNGRVLRTTSRFDANKRMTIRTTWLTEENKLKTVTLQGLSRDWRLVSSAPPIGRIKKCFLDSILIDYTTVSNRLFIKHNNRL